MKQKLGEFSKLLKFMCCSMHSTFFTIFSAAKDRLGFFGVWETALEAVDKIGFDCFELVEGATLKEKLKALEKYGFFQGMSLQQTGTKFVFKIDRCQFAGGKLGIHKRVLEHKIEAPCPLALMIAAYLEKSNPGKQLYVYPTVFTEWSAKTEMEVLTLKEYQEKKEKLHEFVTFETREILSKNEL